MTDLEQQFIERTKKHINLVNEFAAKIGKSYPDHDASKLTTLFDGYKYFMIPREELTKEQEDAIDWVTLAHITNSPHHPEYWTNTNLSGFTRVNFCPNGPIDATEMPQEYLEEMICDWMSVATEMGNSIEDWYNKTVGTRWIFTKEQQDFMLATIEKLKN